MMFEWQRGKMAVSLLLIVFDLLFSHGIEKQTGGDAFVPR